MYGIAREIGNLPKFKKIKIINFKIKIINTLIIGMVL